MPSSAIQASHRLEALPSSVDVTVIGGGVIGCTVALALAQRGVSVLIAERGQIGGEASTAAIGGLTPQSDDFCKGALRKLAVESVAMYPQWLEALRRLTGIQVEYHDVGLLLVARTSEQQSELEHKAGLWQIEGLSFTPLSPDEIRSKEPLLSTEVKSGFHLPGEPLLDPVMLMDCLSAALAKVGCHILTGCPVSSVVRNGDVVEGILLNDGQKIRSKFVVVAAGAWSGAIGNVPPCPVHPVKGQVLLGRMLPQPFRHHVYCAPAYIVPRTDGRVVLGVTYEFAGYDKRVTVAGLSQIIEATVALAPVVADCEVIRYWAGLRPRTPDEKPVIGFSSQLRNLMFATGHFGVGITLAPITGQIVADLLTQRKVEADLAPYAPDRFAI